MAEWGGFWLCRCWASLLAKSCIVSAAWFSAPSELNCPKLKESRQRMLRVLLPVVPSATVWEDNVFAFSFLPKSHFTLFLHVGLSSPVLNPKLLEEAQLYPNEVSTRMSMMEAHLFSCLGPWCPKTIPLLWPEGRGLAILLSRIRNRDLKWKQLRRKEPSQKQDPAGGGQAR